jgi:hypothetical protein
MTRSKLLDSRNRFWGSQESISLLMGMSELLDFGNRDPSAWPMTRSKLLDSGNRFWTKQEFISC